MSKMDEFQGRHFSPTLTSLSQLLRGYISLALRTTLNLVLPQHLSTSLSTIIALSLQSIHLGIAASGRYCLGLEKRIVLVDKL